MKLLSKISYNKTNIILNYKNQDTFSDYNPPKNFYIDNIEIIESERLIKKINYDIETSPFLSNLTSALQLGTLNAIFLNSGELNTEKYNLIYQGSNSFFFNGTDHWGNLNWQSDNYGKVGNFNTYVQSDLFQVVSDYPPSIKLLAEPYSDENPTRFTKIKLQNSFNFNEDERKPLGTESHGVLKQITYPTRGYTEFEFENHEFLTANDLNGDYITDPVNRIKSKASGFRIKSIINHSADGLIATAKHYRYGAKCINASYPNSIEHTGIGEAVVDPNILTYLDYTDVDLGMRYDNYPVKEMVLGKAIEYDYTRSSNYWECNFNSLNFRRLVNGRAPVVYSEVTVYYGDCLDDNYLILPVKTHGKTVFKYDLSDPVEGYVQSSHFEILKAIGTTMYYDEKKDFYNKLSEQLDYSWENNQYKIKSKDVYSWDYNFWNSGVLNYICSNRLPSSILSLLKPYVYSLSDGNGQHKAYSIYNSFNIKDEYIKYVTLNSKTTTQFSLGGDSVKSISKFNYDGYARLQSTTKDNQTTKLKYPDYFSSPVFDKMVEKNMIAPIVSSEVDYKGKTQAGNKTIFKEFQFGDQTLILPAEGYKLEIKPSGNEYSLENQILKYTKNGNPMELVTKDDVHTCYIWSYDDRYMVASIVGASYNTTGDIVSGTTTFTKSKIDAITNSTTTESDYFQKLAEVRSMLTNSQVSTYTYKPLIGISTMTDPRGVTTYYEYDTFNRLKQTYIIENGEKKILQKNDYHYANQQ
jgi:hypothetical protein